MAGWSGSTSSTSGEQQSKPTYQVSHHRQHSTVSTNKQIQQIQVRSALPHHVHQCGHNSNAALMYQYVPFSHLDAEYRIELDQYKEESDSDVRESEFSWRRWCDDLWESGHWTNPCNSLCASTMIPSNVVMITMSKIMKTELMQTMHRQRVRSAKILT